MKVIKFQLSGATAFFKKPDVNTYFYFTYGHIHKVALLGLFGAILGYKGYGQMQNNDIYPEFYQRLKELKLSVVPLAQKGMFAKKIQVFNNSVGYASKEQGGNLIVKEQWLENPKWDIYVQVTCSESENLAEALLQKKYVYLPYLGKNDHFAVISDAEVLDAVYEKEDAEHLDCLFLRSTVQIHLEQGRRWYKYEERLPVALNEQTNLYETEPFVLTNMKIRQETVPIYCAENRLLTFY